MLDEEGYGVRRGGWMRVRRGRLDEDSSIVAV